MEALDEIDYLVDRAEDLAVKAWAEEFKPEPPLPIGTRVKQGVISGSMSTPRPRTVSKKTAAPMKPAAFLSNSKTP